jgi:hypothetical protein
VIHLDHNLQPIYDIKLLTDLKELIKNSSVTSDTLEREIVSMTYFLLKGQISVSALSEENKFSIAACLTLWGFEEETIQRLLTVEN